MYGTPSIFLNHDVKTPRENRHVQLVHHLAVELNVRRRELQGAEDQNLVRNFLFVALKESFEALQVVKS